MKTRHAVAVIAFGLTLATTLFAAEQRTDKVLDVIKLKAHGEVVADIRLYKGYKLQFLDVRMAPGPKTWEHDPRPLQMTVEITPKGDSPITITAEEIDVTNDK